jgi:putative SOS response-associated peptidase YedK
MCLQDEALMTMCSRYTLICDDNFAGRFQLAGPQAPCRSSYNIAPGRTVPVIVRAEQNTVVLMRWGLVPRWAKETHPVQHPINARSDTLAEKPMFRGLLKNNRCIVPATGFYEWKKEGARKIPYYIRINGGAYFSFAGLYDVWRDPSGVDHLTFTIITTDPNTLVAPVHNRMPVILHRESEDVWLSNILLPAADLHAILTQYPAERMESYPVGGRVNNPSVDEETLIRPLTGLS